MHFSALVTGEDVEGQMAPFSEDVEVEPYVEYLDAQDCDIASIKQFYRDNAAQDYARKVVPVLDVISDVGLLREYHSDPSVAQDGEGRWYRMTTRNPQGRWDWWEFGGRWGDLLKFRSRDLVTVRGEILGRPHATDDAWLRERGTVVQGAQGLKGSIDFAAIEADALARAEVAWRVWEPVMLATPPCRPWGDFWNLPDAESHAYHEQPRVKQWTQAWNEHTGGPWVPDWSAEALGEDRERFLSLASEGSWVTHTVVHQGQWSERPERHLTGTEGWRAWVAEVRSVVMALPDDTLISVVDYHS